MKPSGPDGDVAQNAAPAKPDRIVYLDGLRGVAVLAVMAWHYTNWGYEKFLPYGTAYAAIPVLDHGWVGVNIFFMISGFVILLTLESCATFVEFMKRRWSRLFPAMLLASLLIFGIAHLIGDYMPHGKPHAVNLLPGLTFVIPTFWEAVLGRTVYELDGVFWTLYVEMGFYVVFGLFYFWLGWRKGLAGLGAVWLFVITSSRLATALDMPMLAQAITPLQWIGAEYYGWFICGALFFKAGQLNDRHLFVTALIPGAVSAFTSDLWQPSDLLSQFYLLLCVAGFALVQKAEKLRSLLARSWLLFLGGISYPLYLIHNEIGIGFIGKAGSYLSPQTSLILPFVTMAIMIAAAWVIVRFFETPLMKMLRRLLLSNRRTA